MYGHGNVLAMAKQIASGVWHERLCKNNSINKHQHGERAMMRAASDVA